MKEIKTYSQEQKDGVADLVKASASLAYCSVARVGSKSNLEDIRSIAAVLDSSKAENLDQDDLYYLESVLVSTGWNKNDDVFIPEPTWAARNTPEDKQFNFMHDENDIIGHITGSYVIDKDGNKYLGDEMPEQFDIVSQAVIYNSWMGEDNKARMDKTIAEIEEGKWFVSMECLFSNFDYALIDQHGKAQLLQRSEATSFLTKHLRFYGGAGEYEGYKLGRALRDFSFSGKGLVSKPANPRSVILNGKANAFAENKYNNSITFSKGESKMSDISQDLITAQATLKSFQEANEKLVAQLDELKASATAQTIANLEADIVVKDESIADLSGKLEAAISDKDSSEAKIVELEGSLVKAGEELEVATKSLAEIEAAKVQEKRLASLKEAGLSEEDAQASLESFSDINDEAFAAVVSTLAKNSAGFESDEDKKKKEEKAKKEAEAKAAEEEAKAKEEELAKIEAAKQADNLTPEALAELQSAEAALLGSNDQEDSSEKFRSQASEWFANVLNKEDK